jgi:two-component system copper resistance phosphate regulon response regulator CusR
MRILIIEDEVKSANYLSKGLRENNFIVDVANDGEDGLYKAITFSYDLVLLDIMLPKLNGWEITKTIREKNSEIRILLLTACDSLEDKIKGLNYGADDYLVKPFAFSELLARIRSLLRRGGNQQSEIITYSDIKINVLQFKVERASQRIDLTQKEFNLLNFFIQHSGQVLSRTLIAERVWDVNFDCDTNVVDVAIRRLRQKIDEPFPIKLIHTVRGVGYVFEER